MRTLKIVWLCSLSNEKTRKHLTIKFSWSERILFKILGRTLDSSDSAIWNTNAIEEFEKIDEVDLHIVSPVRNLSTKYAEYQENGINYHFFRDENSSLFRKIIRFLFTQYSSEFKINRRKIRFLLNKIHPDLVHVIGAENPQYSLGLYEVPENTPTILQLQALLDSTKDVVKGKRCLEYSYKGEIERNLIKHTDFVITKAVPFFNHIRNNIKCNVPILNGTLAMAQKINLEPCEKEYDFVHYASQLSESKATDVSIKAFGEAYRQNSRLKLDIIGSCSPQFKKELDEIIDSYNMRDAVIFEGRLKTHDDVIKQIRKARFALLPLKISLVPNTLHEAMANGLPLITTETPGTIALNDKNECALISMQDDFLDIASKMLKLLNDADLAERLMMNAAEYEYNRDNNRNICMYWVELYKVCIANKRNGDKIPEKYLLKTTEN